MKLAAVMALVLALAACSGSKPSATQSLPPAATLQPTSRTGSPGSTTGTSTASPGSSRATSGTVRGTVGTPRAASPSVPTEPGVYRYKQSGSSKIGTFTVRPDPEGTLTVDASTAASSGRRQVQTHRYSSNQDQKQTLLFRSDSVELEQTVSSFGGQQQTCAPRPPLTVVELPLKVGATWTDTATCNGINISLSGEVLRTERRIVGRTSVQTFVIHIVSHFRGTGNSIDDDLTTWLSPAYRLSVHSVDKTKGTVQNVPVSTQLTEDLENFAPER